MVHFGNIFLVGAGPGGGGAYVDDIIGYCDLYFKVIIDKIFLTYRPALAYTCVLFAYI